MHAARLLLDQSYLVKRREKHLLFDEEEDTLLYLGELHVGRKFAAGAARHCGCTAVAIDRQVMAGCI